MLLDCPLPLPPIELQNKYSSIAKKIGVVRCCYENSLTDLESLYGALSQQAFKGELDLSRVPLPNIEPEEEQERLEPDQAHAEENLAINLPDTDELMGVLEGAQAREVLITQWLEAYRRQLGNTPLSAHHFMSAAQTRLAELHLDDDFELGANDYEHIKTWVFEALAADKLTQTIDEDDNRIQLKAAHA
jgi:type I restriction enzyme S subunit